MGEQSSGRKDCDPSSPDEQSASILPQATNAKTSKEQGHPLAASSTETMTGSGHQSPQNTVPKRSPSGPDTRSDEKLLGQTEPAIRVPVSSTEWHESIPHAPLPSPPKFDALLGSCLLGRLNWESLSQQGLYMWEAPRAMIGVLCGVPSTQFHQTHAGLEFRLMDRP